jgi:hypothetical protein
VTRFTLHDEKDKVPHMVPEIWRYIAILVIGILCGGAPEYAVMTMDTHNAITVPIVDHEIDVKNAALQQELEDMKEQLSSIEGKVDGLVTFEYQGNRHGK